MSRKRNKSTNTPKRHKVVLYMRFSSKNQHETSIEYQRQRNTKYCEENDYEIVAEYVDEAYTARSAKRPQFQQMLRDAQNHPEWDIVIVYDLSRFARNNADQTRYDNLLRDHDILLLSVTEPFEDTPLGRYQRSIQGCNHQLTSDNIGKHTHDGLYNKACKAQHCGGRPPLGYDIDADKHLIINEDEAEIVRLIFSMYENSFSYHRMADYLNNKGYRTKFGKPFTKNSFYEILQQPKYIGTYVWNRRRAKNSREERNNHAEKPEHEQVIIENAIPAIIDPEQFERVQNLLDEHAENGAKNTSRYAYLLTGKKILHCSVCGRQMVGSMESTHGRKYPCYVCPGHKDKINRCPTKNIPVANVDKFVCSKIVSNILKTEDIIYLNEELKGNGDSKFLRAKLTGKESSISNLLKVLEQGYSQALVDKLHALERERDDLDKKLAAASVPAFEITNKNFRKVKLTLRDYLLESQDIDAMEIIKLAVSDIKIDNDGISVELKI